MNLIFIHGILYVTAGGKGSTVTYTTMDKDRARTFCARKYQTLFLAVILLGLAWSCKAKTASVVSDKFNDPGLDSAGTEKAAPIKVKLKKINAVEGKGCVFAAFHPDGKRWYCAAPGRLYFWENDRFAREVNVDFTLRANFSVSDDGNYLIVDNGIFDLKTETQKEKNEAPPAESTPKKLPFGRSGYQTMASAVTSDMKLLVLEKSFRPPRLLVHTGKDGQITYEPAGPTKPAGPEHFVAVHDVESGEKIAVLCDDMSLGVSKLQLRGHLLALLDWMKGVIYVWNLHSLDKPAAVLELKDKESGYILSFSHDGTRLAAASGQGTVTVWEIGSGKVLAKWSTKRTHLESIAFHPQSGLIATGDGGYVDIWRYDASAASERVLSKTLEASPPVGSESPSSISAKVLALHFSPSGDRLIAGLDFDGGRVIIFKVEILAGH